MALPDEHLSADELAACCWDDGGAAGASAVLGTPTGDGAVAVSKRGPVAVITLVAVAPSSTGVGVGRSLVEEAVSWAADAGASSVIAGGIGPWYLWPGVDVRWTRALCLLDSAGFEETGAALNMSFPTTWRSQVPDGVEVRRVLEDEDAAAVLAMTDRVFGATRTWVAEVGRAIEHGCCHGGFATADGAAIGFGCHSVNRAGWVGPMGVDPERRLAGVGAALLSAVSKDLRAAEFPDAEVAWIGPAGFYARAAGAAVSRVFRTAVRPIR